MKKKFYRSIIFSKTPLKGHFRFDDQFQIYPCDFDGFPKSKHANDIPLLIEFWIDEDENPEVPEDLESIKSLISPLTNQSNKLNQLTRLLSALTNHRITNSLLIDNQWGISFPEDIQEESENLEKISSSIFIGIFTYPGMVNDLKMTSFSRQRFSNVNYLPHNIYYQNDPIDSKDKEIVFPDIIYLALKGYFALHSKSRKIVDIICHLICNGIDIKSKMKSMSFLAFVSSIETLVNFEYKDKKDGVEFECYDCQTIKSSPVHCKKCDRPIWGIKAKFKEFLRTYVATSDEAQAKFNRIYNLRSSIVHSGMLLLGDEQIDWGNSEKADNQFMIHLETMQLARLALVNWLVMGSGKKNIV